MAGEENAVAVYARTAAAGSPQLAAQVAAAMAWAARRGRRVAGVYVDDGVGGLVPLAERPGGARLIADAEAGGFAWVVVAELDRFGRSLPVVVDAQRRLRARGVGIAALREEAGRGSPLAAAANGLMGKGGAR